MKLNTFLFSLAVVAAPASAEECYTIRPAGSSVSFEVKQAGAPFRGAFRRFGGEVCLEDGRAARIDVWLDPASVDTGLPELDAALKENDFFDVGRYPRVTFTGSSAAARGERQVVRGTLEMKGRRRGLEVAFRLRRDGDGPALAGSLTLDRLDYGIGTGEWSDTRWLGTDVKVDFSAGLTATK